MRRIPVSVLVVSLALLGVGRNSNAADDDEAKSRSERQRRAAVEAERAAQENVRRSERRVAESREAVRGSRGPEFEQHADNEVMQVKAHLGRLQERADELGRKLGPDHPDVKATREQIQAVRSKLEAMAARRSNNADRGAGERDRAFSGQVALLRQRAEEQLRKLGPDHPDVKAIRAQIAMLEFLDDQRAARRGASERERSPSRSGGERLEAAARRISHMRQAAEHLKQADVPELAADLMKKAEAMERELQEAKRRSAADDGERRERPRGDDGVADLRAEVERLRAEVHAMRRVLESRKN